MRNFLAISKALSDSNRVRALYALQQDELCVCQIIVMLGLAPSTVSKHMSVLRQAGLVRSRKQKRWMHYSLPKDSDRSAVIRNALKWVFQSLERDRDIKNDAVHLARILKQRPEIICRKISKKNDLSQFRR